MWVQLLSTSMLLMHSVAGQANLIAAAITKPTPLQRVELNTAFTVDVNVIQGQALVRMLTENGGPTGGNNTSPTTGASTTRPTSTGTASSPATTSSSPVATGRAGTGPGTGTGTGTPGNLTSPGGSPGNQTSPGGAAGGTAAGAPTKACPDEEAFCFYGRPLGNGNFEFTIHSAATGYAAIGAGADMSDAYVYAVWKNTNGGYTVSARKSTGRKLPTVTTEKLQTVALAVPAPSWAKIAVTFQTTAGANGGKITPTTQWIWAFSNTPPTNPNDAGSAFKEHDDYGNTGGPVDFTKPASGAGAAAGAGAGATPPTAGAGAAKPANATGAAGAGSAPAAGTGGAGGTPPAGNAGKTGAKAAHDHLRRRQLDNTPRREPARMFIAVMKAEGTPGSQVEYYYPTAAHPTLENAMQANVTSTGITSPGQYRICAFAAQNGLTVEGYTSPQQTRPINVQGNYLDCIRVVAGGEGGNPGAPTPGGGGARAPVATSRGISMPSSLPPNAGPNTATATSLPPITRAGAGPAATTIPGPRAPGAGARAGNPLSTISNIGTRGPLAPTSTARAGAQIQPTATISSGPNAGARTGLPSSSSHSASLPTTSASQPISTGAPATTTRARGPNDLPF